MYTWTDGRKYDGMWQNGKQHGDGVYILPDGTARKGLWKNGKRIKWVEDGPASQPKKATEENEEDETVN